MTLTLEKYASDEYKMLKKLYLDSFPAEERAPFFMIMSKAKKGRAEMLTAHDGNEFVGFAYMVCYRDLAYLFYLAVDKDKRGMGYGRKIVDAVKSRYRGRRIFLAREQIDKSAENYEQRVSRRNFYIRCGFKDLPCHIKEASVIYDVMGIGGRVSADEYEALITSWAGKLMRLLVDMRIIEK